MTRKEIHDIISDKHKQIESLEQEITDLTRQGLMTSDEKQWYTEQDEEEIYKEVRQRLKRTVLVGRVHWVEDLIDVATGLPFYIKRSRAIRCNGEWLV